MRSAVSEPQAATTAPERISDVNADAPRIGRALLVASTGGHLEQITRLEPRFRPLFESVEFATFDDPQSRSLLADRTVHMVERVPPRGLKEAMKDLAPARRILSERGIDIVISTGSAIAVPFAVAARSLGVSMHYVESAARADGPSLTGKILARAKLAHLYSQYRPWGTTGWTFRGNVFDGFRVSETQRTIGGIDRVVVTLGTMRGFPYRRAVTNVQRVLAELGASNAEVLWQVGDTPVDDLGIVGHDMLPAREIGAAIADADLVFGHSGIGTCLQMLDAGHCPVILPRAHHLGEHIDDHQWLIARELHDRNLSMSHDPDEVTAADVVTAMRRVVVKDERPRPFQLDIDVPQDEPVTPSNVAMTAGTTALR
ncbi:MAG: glycosyltransferase [Dermatophilus congolensis]|nr:glycosyltransferase [Dermatophilus congolensis]